MHRFFTVKKLAIGATLGVVIGGSMIAYAYWTAGGTGNGSGTATSSLTQLTVHQLSTVSELYPGSDPQALSGDFDNTNSSKVYVSSVTAEVTGVTGAGTDNTKPACTTSDFAITGTASTPGEVPSGTGVGNWSGQYLSLVDNTSANQDNCKGATAVITYTVNS